MSEIKSHKRPLFELYTFEEKQRFYDKVTEFCTENRKNLLDKNIENRTRHLTVVLEDIFQSQNASAVLRTCDCFGIQDVHVIENRYEYQLNPDVALGSSKWVDYHRYNRKDADNTRIAFEKLHDKGYRIIATLPHENDVMLADLDITQPTALVFGTELTGLSQTAIDLADGYVKIPMYGFTESFNISVSAALSTFYLTEKMRKTDGLNWKLTEEEKIDIKLNWARQSIRDANDLMKKLAADMNLPEILF